MSSQLSTFVCLFDGTNYQRWSEEMAAYLQSQGQWTAIVGYRPLIKEKDDEASEREKKPVYTYSDDPDKIEAWNEMSQKAIGNIRLRLHFTIRPQFADQKVPAELWTAIQTKYSKPGVATSFVEFKGAMDTIIPSNAVSGPLYPSSRRVTKPITEAQLVSLVTSW